MNMLHIELPHFPWQYDATGRRYNETGTIPGLELDFWSKDPRYAKEGYRRYLAQAKFTDRLVGEVIARLKAMGVWDKALVILTADHGVAFRPGRSRRNIEPETAGEIGGRADVRQGSRPREGTHR